MLDIISSNKALKSTWLKRYLCLENNGKWKHLFEWQLRRYGGPAIFRGNLNKQDMYMHLRNYNSHIYHGNFTSMVWNKLRTKFEFSRPLSESLPLRLRHNSLVGIHNKPVLYQLWHSKGIRNVADLLKDRNVFLSIQFDVTWEVGLTIYYLISFKMNVAFFLLNWQVLILFNNRKVAILACSDTSKRLN